MIDNVNKIKKTLEAQFHELEKENMAKFSEIEKWVVDEINAMKES